ncbi:MAG: phosphatidylinositol kinase [Actinomycetota bacterium]
MTDEDCAFDLPTAELVELFQGGDMEIEGRMPYSSNATFLVTVTADDDGPGGGTDAGDDTGNGAPDGRSHKAIYKPGRGERPLWDFPPDLYKREVATFRLAEALGWDVIPPTVIAAGPMGEGSVQAFVDADFSEHYFTMIEAGVGLDDLRLLCALDVIANNTDRKSGHCLLARNGRVYGIDHGLSFHAQFKLRTVMWDFAGEPLGADMVTAIKRFVADGPPPELATLLDPLENDAMLTRAAALAEGGVFPDDDTSGQG